MDQSNMRNYLYLEGKEEEPEKALSEGSDSHQKNQVCYSSASEHSS